MPMADTFRQLGVDVAVGGPTLTGPVLSRRLEAGWSSLRRLPYLYRWLKDESYAPPVIFLSKPVASCRTPGAR